MPQEKDNISTLEARGTSIAERIRYWQSLGWEQMVAIMQHGGPTHDHVTVRVNATVDP